MATAAVAVGSNVDPDRNVPLVLELLARLADIEVVATSAVYATVSVGPDGKPDGQAAFHNAVVLLHTSIDPLDLRDRLRSIETQMGRHRGSNTFAPRPIDLDIVFYDSVIIHADHIDIPDPVALELAHIAVPLADVAPDWRPPGGTTTAAEAAAGHEFAVVSRPQPWPRAT